MSRRTAIIDVVLLATAYWWGTSVVLLLGVSFATTIVPGNGPGGAISSRGLSASFLNWDGEWYRRIASTGYSYNPRVPSNVAFFPLYPLAARSLSRATGLSIDIALIAVSWTALLLAFVVMTSYVRARFASESPELTECTLLVFGLLPTTVFFRMAYSESLFCLLVTLALLGMHRRWPLLVIAVVIAMATATRAVGAGLLPALAVDVWSTTPGCPGAMRRWAIRPALVAMALAVGSLGILAFMGFQRRQFADPLAFMKTQWQWHLSQGGEATLPRKLIALLTLEPIWSVYVPSRPEFWSRYEHQPEPNPLFSLQFANPIYFVATILLVVIGVAYRRLSTYEWLTSACLLLIPYATRSYDNAMASFGRFAAAVIPVYPVMGWLLGKLDPGPRCLVLALFALLLACHAALFAAGPRII